MTAPTEIAGLVIPERIPAQTVLRGQSGDVYVRIADWRPAGYPEHLPPFTFSWTNAEGHGGLRRTLAVEDDGPLEVIAWAG